MSETAYTFSNPWALILLAIPIALLFYRQGAGTRIRYSGLRDVKKSFKQKFWHPRKWITLFRALSLTFLIFAFARPQSGKKFTEVSSEGIDIMLAIDTSGSMQALDFKVGRKRLKRLEVVKKVVKEFINNRPGDRMGIIVFGSDAFTQCPLTQDHGILMSFLDKLKIGMAGEATAIGQAIGIGVKRIRKLKAKSKIMILLTDGRNTHGRLDPTQAAEIAKTFGIKIYTIGVGTNGEAPFLVDHPLFGKRYVYQKVDIDEDTLKEIANTTGGKYYRATQTEELKSIYKEIDRLEKTKVSVKQYTEYNEYFHWFGLLGLVFLLIEVFLGNTRLRKLP